ncbi:MAG: O-antigen ligase family protein [Thermoguttaceae bacterium]|jgi:hypothetical protein
MKWRLFRRISLRRSDRERGRLDAAIDWLLIGLLVFMPLAFGAVEPWSEMVVCLAAAAMSVCLVLKYCLSDGFRMVWTWLYVPILLFLALVAFQLVPLPNRVANWFSPQTVTTQSSLLADLKQDWSLDSTTLSFYPHATKHDLRLALVAATVFVVAVNFYRHRRQIRRLLSAIAAIGCGFAVLALLQVVTDATMIYWTVETPNAGVVTSGSFVNRSHYCHFINLSMGAALAVLLFRLEEARRRRRRSSSHGVAKKRFRLPSFSWLMLVLLLGGVTVFTSLSRNGVISLVVSATFTGIMLARRSRLERRGWLLVILVLVAFAGSLFAGFDALYERFAKIQQKSESGRWEMTLCTLDAWRHYPVWGTGLGTHEFVFPMFDTATNPALAAYADNDYAQMLEEAGLVGMSLVGAFLFGFWWRYGQLIRKGTRSVAMAAFGLGFGLLAVMIHSTTDFGQHVPANFCLSAIACGLMVAIARIEHRSDGAGRSRNSQRKVRRARRLVGATALIGLALLWSWVLWEANASRIGERHWAQALGAESRIRQWNWQAMDEDYVDLIGSAAAAARCEPDNVKPRYYTNLYRWYSISRVVDPDTGRIILRPESVRFAERIAAELSQARILCPTFGPLYTVEGQLRLFFLGQSRGADLIRRAYQLVPADALTCFMAGVVAARDGQLEDATTRFKRAVELNGSYYPEIMHVYSDELNRPDLARNLARDELAGDKLTGEEEQLAGDEASIAKRAEAKLVRNKCGRLLALATMLSASEMNASLAEDIRQEIAAMLREQAESGYVAADELATLADITREHTDYAGAADYYRRAVALNYSRVDWRLALAKILAHMGETEEAAHQAHVCLRLSPGMDEATKLIQELSVRPKTDSPPE